MKRPPFIISCDEVDEITGRYPSSDEALSHGRAIGKAAGLMKIGLHLERLEPGHRLSYPHAEEDEEEFVFVLEGEVDAWIDGHLHSMKPGDLAAFPSGTGICHTFINNSTATVKLLAGGERSKSDSRILYPLNPERRQQMTCAEQSIGWMLPSERADPRRKTRFAPRVAGSCSSGDRP
ncbi:MAG: cupin domain-containing protein [Polyangiales bacterium]